MTVAYACDYVCYVCVNFRDKKFLRGGEGGGENVKPRKNLIFLKNCKTVDFRYNTG